KEDFGLPEPKKENPKGWRLQALAAILCTEAAAKYPNNPPAEQGRIITSGPPREAVLKLLSRWQKQIDLLDYFERLASEADNLTTLQYWARSLEQVPEPLSSPIAERTIFQTEIERLASIDNFEDLARHLDISETSYQAHAVAFWGRQ